MSNAENGARIKAFAGPNVGSGIVKNVTFSHFSESNVDNPLIIDQVSDKLFEMERILKSILFRSATKRRQQIARHFRQMSTYKMLYSTSRYFLVGLLGFLNAI